MSVRRDFLVEIGTEELPPRALRGLMTAFADGMSAGLGESRLEHEGIRAYASPRRLAVLVSGLADRQADREVEIKGPPVAVAFDEHGAPKPAAEAFAKKCGIEVTALERRETAKGAWLYHRAVDRGAATTALAPAIVDRALSQLPIPKPMRWGSGDAEFVRPVHWVVMLYGADPVPGRIFGVDAGSTTYGHRFHAPAAIELADAGEYAERLETEGFVIADHEARLARIREDVVQAAQRCGGRAVADDDLYDEVAALVEWPVAVVGDFDRAFLDLPREVVIATLTSHQRYFPVVDESGALLPRFITISNIASLDPERVREGNERVIRPRLADAAYFWDSDRATPLGDRLPALDRVVYQQGLGSTGDKSRRISRLAVLVAERLGQDGRSAERAGLLAKCDLLTGMVGEFPELQGTMGRYYALASGEDAAVALAIEEQYLPRFAGDRIAASEAGRCLAIAEKLDTLCGIFALGKRPSGNRDPFGLRRSALGIVRTSVEGRLDLELGALVAEAMAQQPVEAPEDTCAAVFDFIVDRLRAYAMDRLDVTPEVFEAVRERRPQSLSDFAERLLAVRSFVRLESAASLAAANKRIGNMLRQAEFTGGSKLDEALLADPAEADLYAQVNAARIDVTPLIERRAYTDALTRLAALREPVDRFFDDVMVMADDESVRRNRLALLSELRDQFLDVADVSRLAIK